MQTVLFHNKPPPTIICCLITNPKAWICRIVDGTATTMSQNKGFPVTIWLSQVFVLGMERQELYDLQWVKSSHPHHSISEGLVTQRKKITRNLGAVQSLGLLCPHLPSRPSFRKKSLKALCGTNQPTARALGFYSLVSWWYMFHQNRKALWLKALNADFG